MNTALILVDIQNDYFPDGRMELIGAVEASQTANKLLTLFRNKEWPIVHIQHIATNSGATFFLPGTEGVKIHHNVAPRFMELIIQKNFPNGFRNTNLLEELQKQDIHRLVICGMMSHMCIDATTRAAYDYGFECVVIHDACATKDLVFNNETIPAQKVQGAFMAALHGTYGKVLNFAQFIAEED